MEVYTFYPSTQEEAEADGSLKFEDSLVYMESSRPGRSVKWDLVSKKKQPQTNKMPKLRENVCPQIAQIIL